MTPLAIAVAVLAVVILLYSIPIVRDGVGAVAPGAALLGGGIIIGALLVDGGAGGPAPLVSAAGGRDAGHTALDDTVGQDEVDSLLAEVKALRADS